MRPGRRLSLALIIDRPADGHAHADLANRFFKFRGKKLEVEAPATLPRTPPQYASRYAMNSNNACACSSRSSPTAARRPQRRSKHSANRRRGRRGQESHRRRHGLITTVIATRHSCGIRRGDADMSHPEAWIWILIPLLAIGIAPFKMWLKIKEKQIERRATSRPRRALNMPSTWSGSSSGCGCSSRSSTDGGVQTAAQIEALRDKERIESKGDRNESIRVRHCRPDPGVRVQHHQAQLGIPARSMREMRGDPADSQETLRLREEVSQLKERIKVLERITVEKENSLAEGNRVAPRPLRH